MVFTVLERMEEVHEDSLLLKYIVGMRRLQTIRENIKKYSNNQNLGDYTLAIKQRQ